MHRTRSRRSKHSNWESAIAPHCATVGIQADQQHRSNTRCSGLSWAYDFPFESSGRCAHRDICVDIAAHCKVDPALGNLFHTVYLHHEQQRPRSGSDSADRRHTRDCIDWTTASTDSTDSCIWLGPYIARHLSDRTQPLRWKRSMTSCDCKSFWHVLPNVHGKGTRVLHCKANRNVKWRGRFWTQATHFNGATMDKSFTYSTTSTAALTMGGTEQYLCHICIFEVLHSRLFAILFLWDTHILPNRSKLLRSQWQSVVCLCNQ